MVTSAAHRRSTLYRRRATLPGGVVLGSRSMGTTGKLVAALLVLCGSSASAQTQPATTSAAQTAEPSCGVGRAGALAEIGCELNRALLRAPAGALVVAAPVASDAKL